MNRIRAEFNTKTNLEVFVKMDPHQAIAGVIGVGRRFPRGFRDRFKAVR